MRKNSILLGLVLVALPLVLFSCSHPEEEQAEKTKTPVRVTIAVSTTPLSAPLYIAQEQGYFTEQNIEPILLEVVGGHKCLKAVLAGDAAMGTTSDLPVMFNSFSSDSFEVAATFVTSFNDVKIMTRKGSGISNAADLKGKKTAVVNGSSSQFFHSFFLSNHGVDPALAATVHMEPPQMPQALANGLVDAVSIWEPFGFEAHNLLGKDLVILPHDKIYRETFNLVVDRTFAAANSELMANILRALLKAINFIQNNENEAQKMIAKRLDKNDDFIQWIWNDFEFNLALDQELILTLEDEAQWALRNRLVEKKAMPNYLEFVNSGPMKKIYPQGITMIH